MKKLILCIILSLVLTQKPQCKVYETYDPKTQKCEKVCEENEYFNEETFECGICEEGQSYNIESKKCEAKPGESNGQENGNGQQNENGQQNDNKGQCNGGKMVRGRCVCPRGQKPINGQCKGKDDNKGQCNGGKMIRGKCVCPGGRPAVNGQCKGKDTPINCRGGRIMGKKCVCPGGKHPVNGSCQGNKGGKCPNGYVNKGGRCVKQCVGKNCRPHCIGKKCGPGGGGGGCHGRHCGAKKDSKSNLKFMFKD